MDIETFEKNDKVVPYCICLKLFSKIYIFWYNESLIIEFIEKISEICEEKEVVIFTHNINFDGLIILDGIKNKNIVFDLFIRDNNIYWIKIKYMQTLIIVRCSYKIIPLSVKSIGKMVGMCKTVFPYKFVNIDNLNYIGGVPDKFYFNNEDDYSFFISEHTNFDLKKIAIEYCINDVEIVSYILNQIYIIIKELKCDRIFSKSYSFSSLSYKIYVKNFDKWNLDLNKNTLFAHNYFKNAYYGGRCEVFGNPTNNKIIHYFDFKGMYAQCMSEKFPIGEHMYKIKDLSIDDIGFHTIKFTCNDYLPFLPYRTNKLIFPNGQIIGTYWCEEIWNAIANNRCKILMHYSSYVYQKNDYVFKNYINVFTELRNKGLYYNFFGKNMCNGLYGSFALDEKNEIHVVCLNDTELEAYYRHTDVIGCIKYGNAYILKLEKSDKSKKILDKDFKWDLTHKKRNIAYAAIIASKARIRLNNAMEDVLKDEGELYYTDTDSIFAGYSESKLNKKLNNIIWTKTYEDGVFISNKFYYIKGDKIKIKGINNNVFSYDEIKNDFYANKSIYVFNDQLNFNRKNMILEQKYLSKNIILNNYDKRIFVNNKTKTLPITVF